MRLLHTFSLTAALFALTACGSADTAADAAADAGAADDAPIELTQPDPAALAAAAPDSFSLLFETSRGDFEVQVRRAWAPIGVDRLHYLATHGFYDGARFYRVVPGFMVQWGLSGRPAVDEAITQRPIQDDPVVETNRRGTLTFAKTGAPNSRTSHLFINFADNSGLDEQGFAPLGEVVSGMDVVDQINPDYGERPDQAILEDEGNRYLRAQFPALDSIVRVVVRPGL